MATEFIVYNLLYGGDESQNQFILTLIEKEGRRALQMMISFFDAQLIALELEKIKNPRPLTHDLLKILMDKNNIKLTKIEITDMQDGVFYAQLTIKNKKETQQIDCRPSDAIVLALKNKLNIEVWDDICEQLCFELDDIPEMAVEGEETEDLEGDIFKGPKEKLEFDTKVPSVSEIERYKKLLESAIEDEDFENASFLRDKIKELENKIKK